MIIFLGNGHSLDLYSDFIAEHKNCSPDIVVSCQYPHKIPDSLIQSHICVNIHYGLLPGYAGCNPIYWQILESDRAGVTLHHVSSLFDCGPIIDTYELPVGSMVASEVYSALASAGLDLLKKNFKAILAGQAPGRPQDLQFRRYYPKSKINFKTAKHLGRVDLDPKRVQALCFEGKQYPVVQIGQRNYELRPLEEVPQMVSYEVPQETNLFKRQ